MAVIVCAGYRLLLFSVKPFSFITPIDIQSMHSRQIINRYGTDVFLCRILVTMSKKSVSRSGEQTFTFIFL